MKLYEINAGKFSGHGQWSMVIVQPFKGIVWEIYECVSEVSSHLGRMFGMIFRVVGSKFAKSVFD